MAVGGPPSPGLIVALLTVVGIALSLGIACSGEVSSGCLWCRWLRDLYCVSPSPIQKSHPPENFSRRPRTWLSSLQSPALVFSTEKSVHRDARSASKAPAADKPQPIDPWLQVPPSLCVATPFLPHVGLRGKPGVATVRGAHCGSTEDFCARRSPPLSRPLPAHRTDFTCRPGARSLSCSFADLEHCTPRSCFPTVRCSAAAQGPSVPAAQPLRRGSPPSGLIINSKAV